VGTQGVAPGENPPEVDQWIGFLGKILTGNHGFEPSNIGFSCKISHDPITMVYKMF
jgi:hypothetical protein